MKWVTTPSDPSSNCPAFRKQAGLTRDQLATRLGMTQQTLCARERNANRVRADRLLQLLGILGVDVVLEPRDPDASPRRPTPTGEAGWRPPSPEERRAAKPAACA